MAALIVVIASSNRDLPLLTLLRLDMHVSPRTTYRLEQHARDAMLWLPGAEYWYMLGVIEWLARLLTGLLNWALRRAENSLVDRKWQNRLLSSDRSGCQITRLTTGTVVYYTVVISANDAAHTWLKAWLAQHPAMLTGLGSVRLEGRERKVVERQTAVNHRLFHWQKGPIVGRIRPFESEQPEEV